MCGIVALFSKKLCREDLNFAKTALRTIAHRGPDNRSLINYNNRCILGHNRLSIIDLNKNSNQPMENKNFSLVYNGMLYNYIELKKELQKRNYLFKTNSDTEVILNSYMEWGVSSFKKFRGMFSIVIYDLKKHKIIFSRDHLGIKPLYYKIVKKKIFICSEIKPLTEIDKIKYNNEAIYNYLKHDFYETQENTFFKNIFQVMPGYAYIYKNNSKFKKEKYWSLYETIKNNKNYFSLKKTKLILKSHFKNISEMYIRSDVKSGLLLSSGIDSNVLKKILETKNKNLNYFTFGFKNSNNDEIKKIKLHKKKRQNHHTQRYDLKKTLHNLNFIQKVQEMPFGGFNVVFLTLLMKIAKKKGNKVMFIADGADELFGGYKKYSKCNISQKDYYLRSIDGTKSEKLYIKNNFEKKFKDRISIKYPSKNNLINQRYFDFVYNKLPRNFRFSDRYSMINSIELRYPFLDYKLVEDSFRINPKHLIKNDNYKKIITDIFNIKQKKQHLNSPQIDWFYNIKFKKFLSSKLKNSAIFSKYLDKNKTMKQIEEYYNSKSKNSFHIWKILNLHLFLELYK
tara:strand:+ start:1344 stop:3044 length:1701 start_codon:yes stop_codon:yes gene_type:complete